MFFTLFSLIDIFYYLLKSLFVLENKIKNISLTYSFYLFITYLVFYSYQYCTIVSLYSICCICKLYLHDFGQYTCIPLSLPAFKGDLILRDVLSQSRENIHIISLSLALKINLHQVVRQRWTCPLLSAHLLSSSETPYLCTYTVRMT